MADEEVFGLEDELPEWTEQDRSEVPDEPTDSDEGDDEGDDDADAPDEEVDE